jgi:hypothetical protein
MPCVGRGSDGRERMEEEEEMNAATDLLEGRERRQDGTSDPDGILTLWRGDDLDLHRLRCERLDLLLHACIDTLEHGGTAREDDVSVEILTNIDIALRKEGAETVDV